MFNRFEKLFLYFFCTSVSRILVGFRIPFSDYKLKTNENRNGDVDKTEKEETSKNKPVKKGYKYRNLNQINKNQNSKNDDEMNTDIGNWRTTKTILNTHSKSSVSQIPDMGQRSGGLGVDDREGGLNEDDRKGEDVDDDGSGDVTLKCLSVAASSLNIQKNRIKEFTVYAGM